MRFKKNIKLLIFLFVIISISIGFIFIKNSNSGKTIPKRAKFVYMIERHEMEG